MLSVPITRLTNIPSMLNPRSRSCHLLSAPYRTTNCKTNTLNAPSHLTLSTSLIPNTIPHSRTLKASLITSTAPNTLPHNPTPTTTRTTPTLNSPPHTSLHPLPSANPNTNPRFPHNTNHSVTLATHPTNQSITALNPSKASQPASSISTPSPRPSSSALLGQPPVRHPREK
eukprot:Sspe_Gene.10392::Locus_3471_Transcript_1_1_Confidence_1.000_Length_992::g.10392::m.10392